MLQHNRLSHAILLTGKEGSGVLPLALAFASHVVARSENATEADRAAVASKVKGMIHPDIHFCFPSINDDKRKKKTLSNDWIAEFREFVKLMPYGNVFDWLQFIGAENKQGNISAEECNDIIRKLSLKTFESPWKVLVLWMPEFLGKEGNKLLKLIEEPPPDTLFLLVAESEEGILPTIISRCQVIRIPQLEDHDIEQALINKSVAPERARQIALISGGNYREALQLLQSNEEDWLSLLRQWLNAAIKGTPKMQWDWVLEMNDLGREKQKNFLKYFVRLLEYSLRVRILGSQHIKLPEAEMDFAGRLNKIANVRQQEALVRELEMAIYYIERNANGKMLFQALTLKLRSIVLEKTIILQN